MSEGHVGCVQLLLAAGAKDCIYDPQRNEPKKSGYKRAGFTSLDFALDKGQLELAALLRDAGGVAPCKEAK